MDDSKLFRCIKILKDRGLSKKPVSIIMNKVDEAITHNPGSIDPIAGQALYDLVEGTPKGEELADHFGRCEGCSYPAFDQYTGPSGSVYCSSDCAWNADDGWDVCGECGEEFSYNGENGVAVEGESFCSPDCFWTDLIKTTKNGRGWTSIVNFFRDHPELDVDRLLELRDKVTPWELIERSDRYLAKLYREELGEKPE